MVEIKKLGPLKIEVHKKRLALIELRHELISNHQLHEETASWLHHLDVKVERNKIRLEIAKTQNEARLEDLASHVQGF